MQCGRFEIQHMLYIAPHAAAPHSRILRAFCELLVSADKLLKAAWSSARASR